MLSLAHKRLPRARVVCSLVAVIAAFAAFESVASAAPPDPSYAMACSFNPGSTTLTWSHVKGGIDKVLFSFYTGSTGSSSIGSYERPVTNTKKPSGSSSYATPSTATFVVVYVEFTGGTEWTWVSNDWCS